MQRAGRALLIGTWDGTRSRDGPWIWGTLYPGPGIQDPLRTKVYITRGLRPPDPQASQARGSPTGQSDRLLSDCPVYSAALQHSYIGI